MEMDKVDLEKSFELGMKIHPIEPAEADRKMEAKAMIIAEREATLKVDEDHRNQCRDQYKRFVDKAGGMANEYAEMKQEVVQNITVEGAKKLKAKAKEMYALVGEFSPRLEDIEDAEIRASTSRAELDRAHTQYLRLRACKERYLADERQKKEAEKKNEK